jgi:predicted Rossmann fold flavoprotein
MSKPLAPKQYDVIVLGGGAAGLMAAMTAGARGKQVLVIECSNKLGKKILMSGGGRCNFTNLDVTPDNFISQNPHFFKSALAQYGQWDFIGLVAKHGIAYHEKTLGQLFCDDSAKDILAMLVAECQQVGVNILLNTEVSSVEQPTSLYKLQSSAGVFNAASLVVATGGLSIPTLGGATGFGYYLAQQFGLTVVNKVPSLVPFTLVGALKELSSSLSGLSVPIRVTVPGRSFAEDMLFTHRGLSGPAILQISNYWKLGQQVEIDLLPNKTLEELLGTLISSKADQPKAHVNTVLNQLLPNALVKALLQEWWSQLSHQIIGECKDALLQELAERLKAWHVKPSGTEGYRKAEVTLGGVHTKHLSSKTMECLEHKGLYFIGEVVDVTGHLGGFNFQWAWSSGYVAGLNA